MTNARAWLTLCTVLGALGSLTVSCGSDEVTGKRPVGDIEGGRAGASTGGRSGTGGASTTTGGSSAKTSNLGKGCVNDANCGTTSGLTCINDPVVPQGLCSSDCETDDDCNALSPGAICDQGLCLEGCQVGPVTGLTDKCHAREDFNCRDVNSMVVTTTKPCTEDEDCDSGSICDQDVCLRVVTACQPACASDDDCASGSFCNIGNGTCQTEPLKGKKVGEACDAGNQQPRGCQGFCIGGGGDVTMCSGLCTFGVRAGCGWDGTGPADAGCLFVPPYINQDIGAGDVGNCAQLCDCNSDCRNGDAQCISFTGLGLDDFIDVYQRQGFCAPAAADDPVIAQCSTGAGGEGGAGGGGAGGGGGTSETGGGVAGETSGGASASGGASGGSAGADTGGSGGSGG
jgi:hypothetical protein